MSRSLVRFFYRQLAEWTIATPIRKNSNPNLLVDMPIRTCISKQVLFFGEGDFVHAPRGLDFDTLDPFACWRAICSSNEEYGVLCGRAAVATLRWFNHRFSPNAPMSK
jgi:hypothetical protein